MLIPSKTRPQEKEGVGDVPAAGRAAVHHRPHRRQPPPQVRGASPCSLAVPTSSPPPARACALSVRSLFHLLSVSVSASASVELFSALFSLAFGRTLPRSFSFSYSVSLPPSPYPPRTRGFAPRAVSPPLSLSPSHSWVCPACCFSSSLPPSFALVGLPRALFLALLPRAHLSIRAPTTYPPQTCYLALKGASGWTTPTARAARSVTVRPPRHPISPRWASIQFRPPICTYAPWPARVDGPTNPIRTPTRKILPFLSVIKAFSS